VLQLYIGRTTVTNPGLFLLFQHFVSDRKIDDDLARTTRFLYDDDKMVSEVKKFGEGRKACIHSSLQWLRNCYI